ncbi:DVU0298 family protein [Desulfopila sp. IMCC35008]|uniref:DVU0298 family protein n=1 Tax=Desulfopila sp. IMCC35008 TaxID=2653858 RepID=UPI0013D1E346|nr:DVU0298 family protein [Desulfopila sp. IMCC35008]
MNRRKTKQTVFHILQSTQRTEIHKQLECLNPLDTISPLFSALCATNDSVRWNGIYCFGIVVPAIRLSNEESARIIMRRLLWSLNDESGGIGWGAPEAMAEIMAQDDKLIHEYLHMFLSYMREDGPELYADGNFLELPMLQRGLLWGVLRLCETRLKLLLENKVDKDVVPYLSSEDGHVRGLAVWCLLEMGDSTNKETVGRLVTDGSTLEIYREGYAQEFTVGSIAEKYLRSNDPHM